MGKPVNFSIQAYTIQNIVNNTKFQEVKLKVLSLPDTTRASLGPTV